MTGCAVSFELTDRRPNGHVDFRVLDRLEYHRSGIAVGTVQANPGSQLR